MADTSTSKGPNVQFATALVYWGAAFLVLILGFRAILETLELASLKMPITYLAGLSLVAEFSLLLFYGYTIYRSKPAEASGMFPPHLTAEIEAMIARMTEAAGVFVTMSKALKDSAEAVEARAVDLQAIAEQSNAAYRQSAETAERRAVELQAISQKAFTAFQQSAEKFEATTAAIMQAGDASTRLLAENQATARQSLEAFIRTTQSFQELVASFTAPLASLESTANSLTALTAQEYRKTVLADILLGVDKTVDDLRRSQSHPGGTSK